MIIGLTLVGSLVVGTLITKFFFNSNSATPQTASGPTTSPAPRAVQKGVPKLAEADLERKATSLPIAECPLNGQEAIPGTVVVHIVINKDGRVTSARASGGDWLLRGAASEAAMKSTFSPEKLRGRETEGTITYTFEP
jgi:TonB family protein